MQEQTPIPKRKSKKTVSPKSGPIKSTKRTKKPVARAYKQTGNNPYAQVPVKTNSMIGLKSSNVVPTSGLGFPGSIIS